MKAKLLQLLSAVLLIGPIAAHAAPVMSAGHTVATEADGMTLFAIALGLLLSLKRRRRVLARTDARAVRKRLDDSSLAQ